jgi:hypothetical protein
MMTAKQSVQLLVANVVASIIRIYVKVALSTKHFSLKESRVSLSVLALNILMP